MAPGGRPSAYDFFGRGGLLQRAYPGYESRPGQIEMAQAVAEALEQRRHLLVEAGTGTGKTLAYLFPVLQSERRVLISTGTHNLQRQLIEKDIPLLERALGYPIRAVEMKGRQNYACLQKIADLAAAATPTLLDASELDVYRQIHDWAAQTECGDRAELEFLPDEDTLWGRLNARSETCTGSQCPRFDDCFLTRLRQRASGAELVIVNHHLFFADLVLKQQDLPGVLPPYEAVIFDEAHELEATAAQFFGVGLSSLQIESLARDAASILRLHQLSSADFEQRLERVRTAAQHLFLKLGAQPGRYPFHERERWLDENGEIYRGFMIACDHLASGLDAVVEKPEELHTLLQRLAQIRTRLAYLLESADEGVVYWLERRGKNVFLQASPIDVTELLREHLFGSTDTVVLTSATLAVEGSFDYVRQRLGVEHARERIVASPFHYPRQALLYLAAHLPPPAASDFPAAAAEVIRALLESSGGRAFLLCTSYAQMRRFHQILEPQLRFPLLLQGSAPRHILLDRFRHTPEAVLIATSSFWQGVDVQGEQLSCVIVDRLPFAVPGDPLVEARIRLLREQGRNPFVEFQIPAAVLALKQGFGRLIRAASDRGVVALLDSRVLTKPYGRHFLRSLPEYACTTDLGAVAHFFTHREPPSDTFLAGPSYGSSELAPDGGPLPDGRGEIFA